MIENPASTEVSAAMIDEATRAIRRSRDREMIARRVIDAVERFITAKAAVLMTVRGDAASVWMGYSATAEALSELAVPLD